MADFDGATAGIAAYHNDQDTQAATMQRYAEIQHMGAITEQAKAQTEATKIKTQREQKMLQLLAQGPQTDGEGQTPAQRMNALGTQLINGGFFEEGRKLANTASEITTREQTQARQAVLAKSLLAYRASETATKKAKQMDSLNNFLAAADDNPEGYDAAKMVWLEENPGEQIPPSLQNYNPGIIKALRKITKSGTEQAKQAAEQAKQAETKLRDKALDEFHKGEIRERELSRKAENDRAAAREKRLKTQHDSDKKTGGDVVKDASSKDIQAAQEMISADYPGIESTMTIGSGKTPLVVSAAAFDLANEARALMARNRGLSMPEAMTQVYARKRQNGEFIEDGPKEPSVIDKILRNKPPPAGVKYKRKAAPAPAAAGKKVPFTSETVPEEGVLYDPGDGSSWKWDAKKKQMVNVE